MVNHCSEERPKRLYDLYAQRFPNVFQALESKRMTALQRLSWPAWCYMPLGLVQWTLMHTQSMSLLQAVRQAPIAVALAAWQAGGQACVRIPIDAAYVQSELIAEGPIPRDRLLRFPFLCAYFPINGTAPTHPHIQGIFVHLEYDLANKREEIRFLLDLGASVEDVSLGVDHLVPLLMEIDEPLPLDAAFRKTYRHLEEHEQASYRELFALMKLALGVALWACERPSTGYARSNPQNDFGSNIM